MPGLDKKDLTREELELLKLLEKMINQLEKLGLVKPEEKKDLFERVANKLTNPDPNNKLDLSLRNILDHKEDLCQALGLACIAELNPKNKFDYTLLLKPQDPRNEKKLKEEMKLLFEELLILRLKLQEDKTLSKEERHELENKYNELAEKLMDKQFSPDPDSKVHENKKLLSTLALFLGMINIDNRLENTETQLRRNLYGVGKAGEAPQVITYQPGDLLGVLDLAADISSDVFMSKRDNPYGEDLLGNKINLFFNALANNPIDTEIEVTELVHTMTSTPPKLTMGNHNNH
jgi:hypothetical protein